MSDNKKALQTLYENLRKNNYDVPDDYNRFETVLTKPGDAGAQNRRTLYQHLKDDDFDVPDNYERFYSALFTPVDGKTSRALGAGETPSAPAAPKKPAATTAQPAQPAQPAKPAAPAGKPMTAAEKAAMDQQIRESQMRMNAEMARTRSQLRYTTERVKHPFGQTGSLLNQSPLQNKRVVELAPKYNPATGKVETHYLTESGNEYDNQVGADIEQTDIDRYKHGLSVNGELSEAYAEQDRIDEALRKRRDEIDEESYGGWKGFVRDLAGRNSTPTGAVDPRQQTERYENDDEYMSLMAAGRKNRATIQLLEDRKNNQMNSFWHSLATTAANGYTFSDGLSETRDAIAVQHALRYKDSINRKLAAGEALTKEEQTAYTVLKNFSKDNEMQTMLGGLYGAWARAGGMTANSIDFMKDMFLMPGAGAIAKGTYKGIVGLGAKYATNKASQMALKATGILIGAHTAGAVISNTSAIGRTSAEMAQNMVGTVSRNREGDFVHEDGMGYVHALAEAERSQIRENGSEMFGEFIPGIGPLVMKSLQKIGLSKVAGALTNIGNKQWYKQYSQLLHAGGWSGMPGEALEEYEGSLFDALTGHAGDAWDDMTNVQNHIDIWLGCASMGALLGAVPMAMQGHHTAQYYRYKHKTDVADRNAANALTEERWTPLRAQIDQTDNSNMTLMVVDVLQNPDLNADERRAALDYIRNLTKMRGYNIGNVNGSEDPDGEDHSVADGVNGSYGEGYETTDATAMNDAKNMMELKRHQLATQLGVQNAEEVDDFIGDPLRYIEEQKRLGNTEGLQSIIEYANAKSMYDGMMQRVRDDIDSRVAESDAMVTVRTNRADGMIHPATMKTQNADGTDRQVYVVSGNVVMYEDGSGVDQEKSDKTIVVRDAETGKLEQVSPDAIFSIDTPVDAEQERQQAADAIREQIADEAAAKIDGTVSFNPGDTYTVVDGQGVAHQVAIVPNEQGVTENEDGTVNVTVDGQPTTMSKEDIQTGVDAANIGRTAQAEQERAAQLAAEQQAAAQQSMPEYNLNDEVTLDNEGVPVRGSVVNAENADGLIEVFTEEPIDGKKVNLFTREQLDGMVQRVNDADGNVLYDRSQTAPVEAATVEEAPGTEMPNAGTQTAQAAEGATEVQQEQQEQPSALERIPKDEQGNPIYEQTDSETAWDAIVEQTGGNETMAKTVTDRMVKTKEAALKRAEKAQAKPGGTIAEMIAAEQERQQAIDNAQAELKHWQQIAGTQLRRQAAVEAARTEEARRAAEAKKEELARQKAEQEEAARLEREALEGVPDWTQDTPADARARGYRRQDGAKYDRQAPIETTKGRETEVKFTDKVKQKGHAVVIDANQLQPSHTNGHLNVSHFIPEAQPKARTDAASVVAADQIASDINPEEITSMVTAYTGAPTVNSRGEVIQGNNRSAALKNMWQNHKDQAEKYKQYLMDHAEEFGLDAEVISKMENPTLVNMVDVDDARAIELGQYVASDTESGGTERIKAQNVVQKMGDDMKTFANRLLSSSEEEASFAQLVDRNGADVLRWMSQKGYITPTQYKSAFDSRDNLTAEATNDLKNVMYQSIFQGGSTQLEEMFNRLPVKAQKAILATAYRDYDSPQAERMVKEIQASIMAYNDLMRDASFAEATNFGDARRGVEIWKRQYQIDDATGESYLPTEKYSNFALHLAAMYRGSTQSFVQSTLNQLFDLIQGTQEVDLFNQDTLDNTPRTLAEAIKEALDIDYNGKQRSNVLAGDRSASQEREQGSPGDSTSGERGESGEQSADGTGGAEQIRKEGGATGTAGADGAERGRGKIKGRKQVQKAFAELQKAYANGDMIACLDAINTMRINSERGDEGAITAEEQDFADKVKEEAYKQGYEMTEMEGKPYNEGMRVEADFVNDETLPLGAMVIRSVKKPQILKDGKLARRATIIVAQHLPADGEEIKPQTLDEIPNEWKNSSLQSKEAVSYVSLASIPDEVFTDYTQSVLLPTPSEGISKLLGANGKSILIKRGVFAKNDIRHGAKTKNPLTPAESKSILNDALYEGNLTGRTQPATRPNYWVVIKTAEKNEVVVLEVDNSKSNLEVVGWEYRNADGLQNLYNQAKKNDGEIIEVEKSNRREDDPSLIQNPQGNLAAGLSALPSVGGKVNQSSGNEQGNGEENLSAKTLKGALSFAEKASQWPEPSRTPLPDGSLNVIYSKKATRIDEKEYVRLAEKVYADAPENCSVHTLQNGTVGETRSWLTESGFNFTDPATGIHYYVSYKGSEHKGKSGTLRVDADYPPTDAVKQERKANEIKKLRDREAELEKDLARFKGGRRKEAEAELADVRAKLTALESEQAAVEPQQVDNQGNPVNEDEYEEVDDNGGLSQEIADKARDYEDKHGDTVVFVKDGERYVVVGQSADFMMAEYDSDGDPMEFNQKEVGEAMQKALDGDMKAVVMENGKVVREETGDLPAAELQDLQSRVVKAKEEIGADVILVRHGSGYVAIGDDAATVQQVTKGHLSIHRCKRTGATSSS